MTVDSSGLKPDSLERGDDDLEVETANCNWFVQLIDVVLYDCMCNVHGI